MKGLICLPFKAVVYKLCETLDLYFAICMKVNVIDQLIPSNRLLCFLKFKKEMTYFVKQNYVMRYNLSKYKKKKSYVM